MPLTSEEEGELAWAVLRMGTFDLGVRLTPFGRRRCGPTRAEWKRRGWIDGASGITAAGRVALSRIARKPPPGGTGV